jgi:leucyl aminopeptidase
VKGIVSMAKTSRNQAGTSAKGPSVQLVHKFPPEADAVAVALFQKTSKVPASLAAVDRATDGALGRVIALGDFKGKAGASVTVPVNGKIKRLIVLGLGKQDGFELDNLRWAAGNLAKAARGSNLGHVALLVPAELPSSVSTQTALQAFGEGLLLSSFSYEEFKKASDNGDTKPAKAVRLEVVLEDRADAAEAQRGLQAGVILGAAANYARSVACRPPNVINPTTLVAEARALAARTGLKIRIIHADEARRLGMGGLVAVGQGSPTPSALILLEHRPGKSTRKPVAVVGKAVTFDTGGISIKPAADMDAMKYDKCGGMAVLGVMQAVAALKLPTPVIGVIPTAENAVDGHAYRPGDIVRMYNGKTVEITNTDAEGRMILADALAYVSKQYEPAAIIDMATLTGGVVVALGSVYAGLMTNNDTIAKDLERAGEASGEMVWRLPLHERYKSIMDGTHADLQNSGGREAHAIAGGIFLQHFVPEKTPWAHVDIAGVAHPKKDDRYLGKGASGFGVRLVVQYLRSLTA